MPTYNNWLQCNLNERFTQPNIDFKVIFNPQPFKILSFEEAVKDSIDKITSKYDNFYISYSGGYDSEFILTTFYDMKIPFKPIIVVYGANELESQYAFHMCRKLNITPIVLNVPETLIFDIYKRDIIDKLNGFGNGLSAGILAYRYVKKHGGTFLTGEHVIDDDEFITKASMCEWDFYFHILYPDDPCVGPLAFTPEITYAIVNEFDGSEVQDFKAKLYNLSYRPKMKPQFTKELFNKYPRTIIPQHTDQLGTKEEFLKMMDGWNK